MPLHRDRHFYLDFLGVLGSSPSPPLFMSINVSKLDQQYIVTEQQYMIFLVYHFKPPSVLPKPETVFCLKETTVHGEKESNLQFLINNRH